MKQAKKMALARLTLAAAMGFSLSCLTGSAFAHGAKPQYGGVVATASDLQFELAQKNGTTVIFVEDHGKRLSTASMSGKITVLNGAEKIYLPLLPKGENQLEVQGKVNLTKGAKAIASIALPDNRVTNVRFAVK